ncbi:hypothetical protein ScPMuIL_015647 [Solemya velum]
MSKRKWYCVSTLFVISLGSLALQIVFFFSGIHPVERDVSSTNSNLIEESHFEISATGTKNVPHKMNGSIVKRRWSPKKTFVFPVAKPERKYLTIGIPTLKRSRGTYVFQTIEALLNNTRDHELRELVIVVFLADMDTAIKAAIRSEIRTKYEQYVNETVLQVIEAPTSFYSGMSSTKNIYKYTEKHNIWKSKQNFDFAYIQLYSQNLSTYYMQIEDDVIVAQDYFASIKAYIEEQKTPWVCLEFSILGFIGKLYHSDDIDELAEMLVLFHEYQPVDITYISFNKLLGQPGIRLRQPTLFQHIGHHSSLSGKIQKLQDPFFAGRVKKYKFENPPAKIFTSLPVYLACFPKLAYSKDNGVFWGRKAPEKGDSYTILFDIPQTIDRIIVLSGDENYPTDRINNGVIQASLSAERNVNKNQEKSCTNDVDLATFQNGTVDIGDVMLLVGDSQIHCLKIIITKKQSEWIMIREIAVFQHNTIHH